MTILLGQGVGWPEGRGDGKGRPASKGVPRGGRLSPHLSGVWPGRKKQVQANSLRF